MVQQMRRNRKRDGVSIFILFIPKLTKIKNPWKVEKRINRALSITSANVWL